MNLPITLISLLVGLGYALPQDCTTSYVFIEVPTSTATIYTWPVVTKDETTPGDLTYTDVTWLSATKTLQTITATVRSCEATGAVSVPGATETVYQSKVPASYKRDIALLPQQCVITKTVTDYNIKGTWITTGTSTSTLERYTSWSHHTVFVTRTDGKAYAIASEVQTTGKTCGDSTITQSSVTETVTQDPRCSPSAMISAYSNYGISYVSDVPGDGATYFTNTTDASACCQLCAEADSCAASAWDIRSGQCHLEFPVDFGSGNMNCGYSLLGYYGAGPNHPMSPGSGWYIANVCGQATFGAAQPDDGS